MKNCGSCKWLDVPSEMITKSNSVQKKYQYRLFDCRVPFDEPIAPAWAAISWCNSRRTCPAYGIDCAFYERRAKS